MTIHTIAVLGSGVMGSGIAAHCANAGAAVVLLDIIPQGEANRNALAEKAIAKQLAAGGFTHPDNAKRITPGNLEDHLHLLAEADWIVEAVLEKLEVKQNVYKKIDPARKKGSVVSSNTSTIPVHDLVSGMSEEFACDCMIAHFFNPPRHMRLLEVVKGAHTRPEAFSAVCAFADERLGKQIVECKDTPGFIANRIGVFWMMAGLIEALRLGIAVEEADAVMGRPAGIPKTGVFGLFDLIGIDLIPLIAKEMLDHLPQGDAFRALYHEPERLKTMIAEGYTGRKGKGGFYRVVKQGDARVKEVLDLVKGGYRAEAKPLLASAKARNIGELVAADDPGGKYAWAVLSQTLAYAASLIPEIADDIASVDEAMRSGYSWQMGPFEMIDAIGVERFTARLKAEGRVVPKLLENAGAKLYSGVPVPRPAGHLWLKDAQGTAPVLENGSAKLWDLGEGVACLEFTTKMHAVDDGVIDLLERVVPVTKQSFRALVIGNDSPQFCVGANLNVFLERAKAEDWPAISAMIARGQEALMALKYAPFPAVAALAGLALGGGCEVLLHMDAVQAHIESQPGLVEPNVGLIPAWGGCKEMLLRHEIMRGKQAEPALSAASCDLQQANRGGNLKAFELIISAKTAQSAQEAKDMRFLNAASHITMNRARVLFDARARANALAEGYIPPVPAMVECGGAEAKNAMLAALEARAEKASPHELIIGRVLAHVLSGGESSGSVSEQKLLGLELEGFMELIRTRATQERIAHMLNTGKPLRN